eukprot:6181154-Pleurochrysis_carterae.AAC.1
MGQEFCTAKLRAPPDATARTRWPRRAQRASPRAPPSARRCRPSPPLAEYRERQHDARAGRPQPQR